jgi:hypothetical protein
MKINVDGIKKLYQIATLKMPERNPGHSLTFFMAHVDDDETISLDTGRMSWEIYITEAGQTWWVIRNDYIGTLVFDANILRIVKRFPGDIDSVFSLLKEKQDGGALDTQAPANLNNK